MTLELVVRSSAMLVVVWLMTRCMFRASAAARHLAWHAGIGMTLALAALAQVPQVPKVPIVPQVPVPQVLQVLQVLRPASQIPNVLMPSTRPLSTEQDTATQSALGTGTSTLGTSTLSTRTLGTIGTLGTLGTLTWFTLGWLAAARLTRRSTRATAAWQLEVNVLCDRMRISREVRLGIIDGPVSPLATGVWRAAILLPQSSASWSAERRQAVLLHELAHIRRNDCRVQLLAQAACALYWFNPLIWMAVAHLRAERERACDDEVLRQGAQPSSYAAHLLDIARGLRPAMRPSAALAMARPRELEDRLLAVLASNRARIPSRAGRWAIITAVTIISVVALSATSVRTADMATPLETTGGYVAGLHPMEEEDRLATRRDRVNAERTLERSSNSHDRELAVLALAFSSGRDVIPALLEALGDDDAQVREKAAIGLALRRDARVVEPLLAAMRDPDAQVREKVAIALGTSGDSRAGAALEQALHDPDRQVREKARAGLVLLGLMGK